MQVFLLPILYQPNLAHLISPPPGIEAGKQRAEARREGGVVPKQRRSPLSGGLLARLGLGWVGGLLGGRGLGARGRPQGRQGA